MTLSFDECLRSKLKAKSTIETIKESQRIERMVFPSDGFRTKDTLSAIERELEFKKLSTFHNFNVKIIYFQRWLSSLPPLLCNFRLLPWKYGSYSSVEKWRQISQKLPCFFRGLLEKQSKVLFDVPQYSIPLLFGLLPLPLKISYPTLLLLIHMVA